jgi:RNA polymerase sigma-70 factor (ECF subfamily)
VVGGYKGRVAPTADAELVRGYLAGDAAAARQVDLWILEVLRHPRLTLGNDVDDLAQQVRRKLLISLRAGRFQHASSLRTYTWRAAQHTAIDYLRARRVRPFTASFEDQAVEPADPAPSPEAVVLQQERRDLLARVLARLGDDCRQLLQLIVFDELNYRDIATRLGATEGAIKVRALRCREKATREYRSVTTGARLRPSSSEAD